MTLSLLIAGVLWNLGTWYVGLPVSSSHTLIGSILGVGIVNSLLTRGDISGVNWEKASEVMLSLLISPIIGFGVAASLLWACRLFVPDPELYVPPEDQTPPPAWIRGTLLLTCDGVSFAHGSNDGQKGMGLILLVLIGFLPGVYALNLDERNAASRVNQSAQHIRDVYKDNHQQIPANVNESLRVIDRALKGKQGLSELQRDERWNVREAIYALTNTRTASAMTPIVSSATSGDREALRETVEYVPFWVVLGVATALGCGTMIGYKRIVVTVAEKIGKHHLAYAQGASAEVTTMLTILMATRLGMPVSTTHVLTSGIAGTMWANQSGIQKATVARIAAAWTLTLPMSMAISGGLYFPASQFFR
jgi:phosphate/sulfate permease